MSPKFVSCRPHNICQDNKTATERMRYPFRVYGNVSLFCDTLTGDEIYSVWVTLWSFRSWPTLQDSCSDPDRIFVFPYVVWTWRCRLVSTDRNLSQFLDTETGWHPSTFGKRSTVLSSDLGPSDWTSVLGPGPQNGTLTLKCLLVTLLRSY